MPESINQRLNGTQLDQVTLRNIRVLLESLRADIAAIATKLNADAGVTDTNYNANPNTTP